MTYRPEIDGLRAVAVLAVIVNHLDARLLPGGFLGVDIFFVISGYVVTSSLAGAAATGWTNWIATFYARRVKRLLPALVLCIVSTAIVGSLVVRAPGESLRTGMAALVAASNIYLWNQATDYFSQTSELNLYTHTWSLGAEEQFYLVFPLLLGACGFGSVSGGRKEAKARAAILIATIASLLYFVYLSLLRPPSAFFLMPARFWELGLGAMTFLASAQGERLAIASWNGARAALGLMAIVGVLFVGREHQMVATLAIGFLTCGLLWSLHTASAARSFLTLPFFVKTGLLSYSLYLWHWPVVVFGRWTIGLSLATAPIFVLSMAGLALASYRFVEQPLRHARWTESATGTIGRGLAGSLLGLAILASLLTFGGRAVTDDVSRAAGRPGLGVRSLADPWMKDGKVVWEASRCVMRVVGLRADIDGCTFGDWRTARRRVLVLGDSFAAAEIGMFRPLAETHGLSFTLIASWGAAPAPGIDSGPAWMETNRDYWGRMVPALVDQLRPGDVILILTNLSGYAPQEASSSEATRTREMVRAVDAFAAEMGRREVGVVFQTVTPFIDGTVFLTRSASLARRESLHKDFLRLQTRQGNFRVLDIFDVLCPGPVCGSTAPDGAVLFRDEFGHPSVLGAARATEELRKLLDGSAAPVLKPVGELPVSRLKNRAK